MTDSSEHFPPDCLEKFEPGPLLGRGSFGYVFRATQRSLRRPAAVKVIRPNLRESAEQVQRFIREAKATAKLSHPNVVRVIDFGAAGDRPWIAYELIEGTNLQAELATGPPALPRALDILTQIASGIAHAHSQGILHRDIKPANVMRTADGTLKVTDFGLARFVEDGTLLTRENCLVGTPAYIAPELGMGEEATYLSEIYAYGVLCFEVLTGRVPIEGTSPVDQVRANIEDVAPRVSTLRSDIPETLDRLVDRMLAKHPTDRPAKWNEILDVLQAGSRPQRAAHGIPAAPGTGVPAGSTVRLPRGQSSAVFATAALAGILLAVGVNSRDPGPSRLPNPVIEITFATPGQARVRLARPPSPGTLLEVREKSGRARRFPVRDSTVTLDELLPGDELQVDVLEPGHARAPGTAARTPRFYILDNMDLHASDRTALLIVTGRPAAAVRVQVRSLRSSDPPVHDEAIPEAIRFHRMITGLEPATDYLLDVIDDTSWGGLRSYPFRTPARADDASLHSCLNSLREIMNRAAPPGTNAGIDMASCLDALSRPDYRALPAMIHMLRTTPSSRVPVALLSELVGYWKHPEIARLLVEHIETLGAPMDMQKFLSILTFAHSAPHYSRAWKYVPRDLSRIDPTVALLIAHDGTGRAYKILEEVIRRTPDHLVSPWVSTAMLDLDHEAAVRLFHELLEDPSASQINTALHGCLRSRDVRLLQPLLQIFRAGNNRGLRWRALDTLMDWAPAILREHLPAELAKYPDDPALLWAAVMIDVPDLFGHLDRVTRTHHELRRTQATLGLGRVITAPSTARLLELVGDSSVAVRRAACWALGQHGSEPARDALRHAAASPGDEAPVALASLAQFADAGVGPLVLDRLRETARAPGERRELLACLVHAATALRLEEARPILDQIVKDPPWAFIRGWTEDARRARAEGARSFILFPFMPHLRTDMFFRAGESLRLITRGYVRNKVRNITSETLTQPFEAEEGKAHIQFRCSPGPFGTHATWAVDTGYLTLGTAASTYWIDSIEQHSLEPDTGLARITVERVAPVQPSWPATPRSSSTTSTSGGM